jgi:hypothetical protein
MVYDKNIIIYPHNSFDLSDSEIYIQYYLANVLDILGLNVKICNVYDKNKENILYNKFQAHDELNQIDFENTIVIYSEGVIGNPLKAIYVIRWVLGKREEDIPLDYYENWGDNELIYFLNKKKDMNAEFTKQLTLFCIYEELRNLHTKREGTCFLNKNGFNSKPLHEADAYELTQSFTQTEYADIFNSYETFISYDPCIFVNIMATLCGCISVINPIENVSKCEYLQMTIFSEYMKEKNIHDIYGIAYGISESEINYAIKTAYLLKCQILDIQNWYIHKYVKSFVNDLDNWSNNHNRTLYYKTKLMNDNENMGFNIDCYLEYNPDLYTLSKDYLLQHYELYGKKEGRIASKNQLMKVVDGNLFDIYFYKKCNSDLEHYSIIELIQHYINYGKFEGRIASKKQLSEYVDNPFFDLDSYIKYNDELQNQPAHVLINDYKNHGKKNGKISSNKELLDYVQNKYFNLDLYKQDNPELFNYSNHKLIEHYKNTGKKEDNQLSVRKKYNYRLKTQNINIIYSNCNVEFIDDNIELITNKINQNKDPKQQFRNICKQNIALMRKFSIPEFPSKSQYESVLIEYRCLPHLEFLIRNTIIKLGNKWAHTVICGNINFNYMYRMCSNISPNINVIKTDYDNLTQKEYSLLLTTMNFWNLINGEKILIYQEDTLIFKDNIEDFLKWDYIGAPWIDSSTHNSKNVGNGGFSLRSKSIMKQIIGSFNVSDTGKRYVGHDNSTLLFEDVFFTKIMDDFNIGKLADSISASNFSTESIVNTDSLGGHNFWINDINWRQRINTIYNFNFDYALVFICHDLSSFIRVEKYLNYKNGYIIFVGDKDYHILYTNPKIIIARNYPENIEKENKLLTFTAWYLIVKNNLFTNFTHICLFEYDVVFESYVLHNLNIIYNKYDIVTFKAGNFCFEYDVNIEILHKFLKNKNIENYDVNSVWYHSTNHCVKRELLVEFVNWYYPDCFYLKLYHFRKFSYYHERLFSVFVKERNENCFVMNNCVEHIQRCSHDLKDDKIKPKKVFLTYNDNSKIYSEYNNYLKFSVKKYSDFTPLVFNKNDIDEYFKNGNADILNENIGGGYWLWKPYIILTTLNLLKENDILFYLDSKYFFVENFEGLYEEHLKENDIVVWKNKPNEEATCLKNYCKMDVIQKYDMKYSVFDKNAECCWAGAIMIKKTDFTLKIISEWLEMCSDYHNISNIPSSIPNSCEFIEHRHDQSLLSIVLYKNNIKFHYFPKKYLQNIRYPW